MAQTSLHIRMDEEMKKQFDEFCNELGMSMSTAVCLFIKRSLREHRIPFELSAGIPEKKPETDVSRRIGIAKNEWNVPEKFAEWDKEVENLFEESGLL